jgi:hypothetical protein
MDIDRSATDRAWIMALALAGCSPDSENVGDVAETGTPCDGEALDPYVDDWVSSSMTPPVACGDLSLGDADELWLQARDCALANAADGVPFVFEHDGPSIDSNPRVAFVARDADDFEIALFRWDHYDGVFMMRRDACEGLAAMEECSPIAGYPCLECVGPTEGEFMCG